MGHGLDMTISAQLWRFKYRFERKASMQGRSYALQCLPTRITVA